MLALVAPEHEDRLHANVAILQRLRARTTVITRDMLVVVGTVSTPF